MSRVLQGIDQFGLFVRFTALGFSLVLPLLGAATVQSALSGRQVVGLLAVGVAIHCFGYVLNDVVDLPVDRTEPRRAANPLVRGAVRPWQALCFAGAQVPLALGVTAWLGGLTAAYAALIGVVSLTVVYDLWGKRMRYPLVTDVAQGCAWGCLVLYGAAATAGVAGAMTGLLIAFEIVFILMVNGVHGALRDLANDLKHGVRTTASVLGARTAGAGLAISPALARYSIGLQAALTAIALWTAIRNDLAYPAGAHAVTILSVAVVSLVSFALLRTALRSGGRPDTLIAAGMLHVIVSFAAAIVVVGAHPDRLLVAVLAAVYLGPLFAHEWLYEAFRWMGRSRLWQRMGGAVELLRPHNCLAAALTTLLGAYLSNGSVLPPSRSLIVVTAAMCVVVAVSNVVNDYHDVAVDTLNYPRRPIPSGRVTRQAAGVVAVTLGAAGVIGAATLGRGWAAIVGVYLILGVSYSYVFKSTVLVGNALIAALCGGLVVAGALTASVVTHQAMAASVIVCVFMFAYEVLNSLVDLDGDTRVGLTTVATRWRRTAVLHVYQVLVLLFVAVALLPWLMGIAGARYLYSVLPCSVLPTVVISAYLSAKVTDDRISVSRQALKFIWFSSLLPMAMMR